MTDNDYKGCKGWACVFRDPSRIKEWDQMVQSTNATQRTTDAFVSITTKQNEISDRQTNLSDQLAEMLKSMTTSATSERRGVSGSVFLGSMMIVVTGFVVFLLQDKIFKGSAHSGTTGFEIESHPNAPITPTPN